MQSILMAIKKHCNRLNSYGLMVGSTCLQKPITQRISTAYMWIMNKIKLFANRIREQERLRISSRLSDAPKHLT